MLLNGYEIMISVCFASWIMIKLSYNSFFRGLSIEAYVDSALAHSIYVRNLS